METHEVLRMLDEAKKLNFVSYIAFGGEPLIRPDIFDILQHAHDLGLYTILITNGFYLSEEAGRVRKAVDLTLVSLDHFSDYHDQMRGLNGVFDRALDGIVRLRQAGGRVGINCVLSRLNGNVVREMAEFARRFDVKLAFDPMQVFQGSNEEYALTSREQRQLFSEILGLKHQGYSILNSVEYLTHLANSVKYSCAQPKIFIMISADGIIKPFWCEKTNSILGDLRKNSLSEILRSPSFKEFSRVSRECNSCVNSSTMESSIFYSFRHALRSPLPYCKFLLDYAF